MDGGGGGLDGVLGQKRGDGVDGFADLVGVGAGEPAEDVLGPGEVLVDEGDGELAGEVEGGAGTGGGGSLAGAAALLVEPGFLGGLPGQGQRGGQVVQVSAGHSGEGGVGEGVLAAAGAAGPWRGRLWCGGGGGLGAEGVVPVAVPGVAV